MPINHTINSNAMEQWMQLFAAISSGAFDSVSAFDGSAVQQACCGYSPMRAVPVVLS
jgi:hypothetical protein